MSLDVVKRKIKFIDEFENNEKVPTLKQLSTLADLYEVPRWVFIADELPKEYQYYNTPAFRRMQGADIESPDKVHKLITRVEQYRSLFLELRADMDNPIAEFVAPDIPEEPAQAALVVRQWLSLTEPLDFDGLRQKLEEKNIFVFCTNKYTHWSKTNTEVRGLSIFYDTLPVIIINDSDYRKAQSFTLMHELGHVLRKKTEIDGWRKNTVEESWCDKLAGSVLMPEVYFVDKNLSDLDAINRLAERLKVSTYSCLVRARHLDKVTQEQYNGFEAILKKKHEEVLQNRKNDKIIIKRNRINEVKKQFSVPFVRTVVDYYHREELNLHQSTRMLDLKRASQFLELAGSV